MKTYLIQRGEIQNNSHLDKKELIQQFNSITWEHLNTNGGALPDSLKRLRTRINEYTYLDVLLFGKCISVFCNNEQKTEVMKYLKELANYKIINTFIE